MLANVAGHNLIMVLLDADSNPARLADAQRLRRWVVAQNGWKDDVPVAQAGGQDDKPRRSARAKKRANDDGKRKTAVAKKETARKSEKTAVDAGKKDARKEAGGKDGRVRQSFAAGKDAPKS
jgi:serine-type D-Ala-D-Ala endopeptidase (penicillin-binding protein 7)